MTFCCWLFVTVSHSMLCLWFWIQLWPLGSCITMLLYESMCSCVDVSFKFLPMPIFYIFFYFLSISLCIFFLSIPVANVLYFIFLHNWSMRNSSQHPSINLNSYKLIFFYSRKSLLIGPLYKIFWTICIRNLFTWVKLVQFTPNHLHFKGKFVFFQIKGGGVHLEFFFLLFPSEILKKSVHAQFSSKSLKISFRSKV